MDVLALGFCGNLKNSKKIASASGAVTRSSCLKRIILQGDAAIAPLSQGRPQRIKQFAAAHRKSRILHLKFRFGPSQGGAMSNNPSWKTHVLTFVRLVSLYSQ